jgi:thiol:disulfide interchange protein DsbD
MLFPARLTRDVSLAATTLALAAAFIPAAALAQEPVRSHVKATLLAEADAVRPGQPLLLGIRLEMEEGWHTYWKNPGDSGLATRVRWQLPQGFEAGEIQWPRPLRFSTGPLVSYGYERDVLLLVEVKAPPTVAGREVRLAGRVDWLECLEACIPGKAELALTLPVRPASAPGPHAALFAEARRRLPMKDAGWRFAARPGGDGFLLDVRPPRGTTLREAWFYAAAPRVVDHAGPQTLAREGAAHRLSVPRDRNGSVERLSGVLVAETEDGTRALDVDVPLAGGARTTSSRTKESKP